MIKKNILILLFKIKFMNYRFQWDYINKIMDIPTQKFSDGIKKVFVTGAAGFVGSHLAHKLVKDGYEVHILIRPSTNIDRIRDIVPGLYLHTGDLADRDGIRRILHGIKPDGIFHLAVSTIASGKIAPPEDVIKSNFTGTVNIIDAIMDIDYKFFVNTGSFLEYGPKKIAIKESDICEPPELYSITKLAGVLYGQAVARIESKPIINLRIFTPYGPFMQKGRLVYEVIHNALRGKEIMLTHPQVTRDFIYVEDIVSLYKEAAMLVPNLKGEIFNVGSGIKTTLADLVKYVMEITSSFSKINWGSYNKVFYDSDTWQADMTKTFNHFQWRPTFTLEQGILKTIAWLRNSLSS